MGGAVVSNVNGSPSVYYNPAGLLGAATNEFLVAYQRGDFSLNLNDESYDVESASNLLIGMTVPIPFGGVLEDRFALGVGFLIPMSEVLRAHIPAPEEPWFALVETRAHVIGLHLALGIRIFDWLQVGGGAIALASLHGGLAVTPNDTGNLGTTVRDELIADYAPIFGLLVEPIDWLSIGMAFHGTSRAEFTFPITADLGSEFPIEVPLLNVVGIAQYDPLQVSSDITFSLIENLSLAAGASFKLWSDYENPLENTTEAVPPQDPAGFVDIWVPRFGAEYTLVTDPVEWQFRLGGFYEPSPVRQQVGNNNYLDSDRMGIGLGFGLTWEGLTFDAAFQAQLMSERTHTKQTTAVRDPENAGLPSITHSGNIYVSIFEFGAEF